MALNELALPIDVPWKRMGASGDMIDRKAGDSEFPEKWRSSIAVFYHEPEELPPAYCERRITYLKVVCTVTNYAPYGEDVTILNSLGMKYNQFHAWKNFESSVNDSFPCYGALLQVGVHPNPSDDVKLHDYPYISSLQPRKREMYETLTESGEVNSKSAGKINVGKQLSSTNTNEEYDIDQGFSRSSSGSGSALFGLASGSSSSSYSEQGQWGTINRSEVQNQHITNTDSSREKRESHGYSTTINQLYNQLQSYHLGTNRAIFFMQPRPHIQDAKFTFIRGLRRLEGIQEFFLIVNRPKHVKGFCVDIALETAHAYLRRAYRPRIIPRGDLWSPGNLDKTAQALGLSLSDYPYHRGLRDNWNKFSPWVRFLAHESQKSEPGYLPPVIDQRIKNGDLSWQEWGYLKEIVGQLPDLGTEEVALIFEEYESDSGHFFVTGRKLCSCYLPRESDDGDSGAGMECEESRAEHISSCDYLPFVTFEKPYTGAVAGNTWIKNGRGLQLNAVIEDLNKALWKSLAAHDRKPYGRVSFLETDFVLDELSQLLRLLGQGKITDVDLSAVPKLSGVAGGGRMGEIRTVLDLGMIRTNELAARLGVTADEARATRKELLVEGLRALDERTLQPGVQVTNPLRERLEIDQTPEQIKELTERREDLLPRNRSGLNTVLARIARFFSAN